MLKIRSNVSSDSSITSMEYHAYNPYTTAFGNNDEIRIAIQQQDLYVLPSESFIYIEGTVARTNLEQPSSEWSPNHAYFLFDDIRYELNGIEIDRCKNVGITTMMKGVVSIEKSGSQSAALSSFAVSGAVADNFSYCIPLKMVLGFTEDYKKIVMNMKHELILIRSRNDLNCFMGVRDNNTITLNKIQWRIPHIQVDDYVKLQLLKQIDENKSIPVSFRSWDLYEYPTLPQNQRNVWAIKTSNNLHKPRYVIFGMQTNRNAVIGRHAGMFDHCNLSQVKLYLNSVYYPYENTTINFAQAKTSLLYQMYCKFQESYYHDRTGCADPFLVWTDFIEQCPVFVFDCSRQNEALKSSLVDIRIEYEASANIPANTRAFCLVLHDNIITYNPYTNIVVKSA